MASGVIFIAVTGLLWMLVGVIYSKVNEKAVNFPAFMFFYSLLFFAIIHLWQPPPVVSVEKLAPIAVCMLPSALLGQGGFMMLYLAMKKTSHAVAWTFAQSAMIIPFLGGWLLLGNQVNWINLSGMILLLAALLLLGKGQNKLPENNRTSYQGLILCIISLLLTGVSQFLTLLAGEFCYNEANLLAWRLPLVTWPGIFSWGAVWLIERRNATWKTLCWALLYAAVVSIGQIFLYMALDRMQMLKLSNIVYPAAISICIVLFVVFCRIFRHEVFNLLSASGVILIVLAISMLFA